MINNTVALAKSAKIFNVPVILTTVETKSFSGNMWPQILELFPGKQTIERTSMNSWEEKKFVAEVERIGRKKLVIAALWTEVCLCFPAIQAMEAGYEVYAVEDASGGTSETAHRNAMQRVVQAGAVPVTWLQVLLEFQRDWARRETYDAVMKLVIDHAGAYGQGVEYAYTMVHGQPPFPGSVFEIVALIHRRGRPMSDGKPIALVITRRTTAKSLISGDIWMDADLILHNGSVTTLDPKQPEAQAIAIQGGRIAAVGDGCRRPQASRPQNGTHRPRAPPGDPRPQ